MESRIDILIRTLLNEENRKTVSGYINVYKIAKWELIECMNYIEIYHNDCLIDSIFFTNETKTKKIKESIQSYLK